MPVIHNIRLTAEQTAKFSLKHQISQNEKYEGQVSSLNGDPATQGSVFVSHLNREILFLSRSMKRPFSIQGLKVGDNVVFNLRNNGNVIEVFNLFDNRRQLPEAGDRLYEGKMKVITDDKTSYGFAVIDDVFEVLVRRQDIVNQDEWDQIKSGSNIVCKLSADGLDKYRATNVTLGTSNS